jgi:calcineurin-like phosphoesterase family protein|tara:strand:- start:467 stop:646 length:180 start_codon:yes stop_codon:yes gene_type:complete
MKTFTFENHLGDTFVAKAENGLDIMEDANRKILWPNWKDGMWQQVSDTKFVWVLGNFFD